MGVEKFPFMKLKVDRQYVAGWGNGPLNRTVCRHIVYIAKEYNVRTVAAGVEPRRRDRCTRLRPCAGPSVRKGHAAEAICTVIFQPCSTSSKIVA